jgi:KipI family sensor histidine kinase inhibitor
MDRDAVGGQPPRIVPFGDAALLVILGDAVDPALNARAQAVVRAVEADRAAASGAGQLVPWGRPVPAYASVLVPVDPLASGADGVVDRLRGLVAGTATAIDDRPGHDPQAEGPQVDRPPQVDPLVVDVRYGGDDGPDLPDVARALGLTEDEVIAEHVAGRYRVYFLGFAPGWAYLGPLSERLRLPRRATPRTRVPAGSVAIAGAQTGVYPSATPGGWHLIGRTDVPLWQPDRDPPALLRAGQEVRFHRIDGG